MNPNIAALLDLQVIDRQRQVLKLSREARKLKLSDAEKTWKAAEATSAAATQDLDKLNALVRQYTSDSARCDATIADLRSKQMGAKTNKDYMAIINGIELAKVEKTMREQSIKEIGLRVEALKEKAAKAAEQSTSLKGEFEKIAGDGGPDQPTSEELEIQKRYDDRKAAIDAAFLETYERLVKARHPMPLAKVDPASRATPMGVLISHNQIEQIRMGKLVVDRTSNSILYLAERPARSTSESGKRGVGESA